MIQTDKTTENTLHVKGIHNQNRKLENEIKCDIIRAICKRKARGTISERPQIFVVSSPSNLL